MRSALATAPVPVIRVLQFAIDLLATAVLCALPLLVMLMLPRNPDGTVGSLLVSVPVVLGLLGGSVALSWWYWAARPARHAGQTFAMRWLGLAVTRTDGRAASRLDLSLRWAMLLVDGALFGVVGLTAMLLTPSRQRLGDVVADTVVVRTETW